MNVKLAYGIRDGRVVHISELNQAEKGEKCHCICPVCNGILLARLGDKRQWHFAHKATCDCDIAHAQQTGLHLLAKEIIQESRKILVPGLVLSRLDVVENGLDINIAAKIDLDLPCVGAQFAEYTSVEIEKAIGGVIADTVITVNGKPCIIEIAVTHFVDEDKKKKLETINLPAFEIDLSHLIELPMSRDSIAIAVLSDESNRQWVVNPKKEKLLKEKKAEFTDKYEAALKEREKEERRKQKYREKNLAALRQLFVPENYAEEIKRLRNDKLAALWLKRFAFAKGIEEYPFYMNIPITGEFIFSCDRRIWQGKLFEDYVFRGFDHELCTFSISQIQKRISKGHMIIQYNKKRMYQTTVELAGREQEIFLPRNVVKRYFDYLELIGFVSHVGYEWFSRRPASLEPPNKATACIVKAVFESVDSLSPDVDRIAKTELQSRLPESEKTKILEWNRK